MPLSRHFTMKDEAPNSHWRFVEYHVRTKYKGDEELVVSVTEGAHHLVADPNVAYKIRELGGMEQYAEDEFIEMMRQEAAIFGT